MADGYTAFLNAMARLAEAIKPLELWHLALLAVLGLIFLVIARGQQSRSTVKTGHVIRSNNFNVDQTGTATQKSIKTGDFVDSADSTITQ